MAEGKKERVIRSKDERKTEVEKKIKYHEDCIVALKQKLEAIDSPRKSGSRAKGVKRIIQEAKLSDEDTAKALGITVEELRTKLLEAAAQKGE